MSWVSVALAGYFLSAVSALLDKYLLSDSHIKGPAAYAFFVALFSFFAIVFIPFGFRFFGWQSTALFLVSGILFLYGLTAFYAAVKANEVSRIAPLVGTTISAVAMIAAFVPGTFSEGGLDTTRGFALLLLIGGGLLIAFDLPLRKGERIPIYVIIAGVLIAFSILLLKQGYAQANFVSGLVWSRLGMFGAGLSLLLIPAFRHQILEKSSHFSTAPKSAVGTGAIFLINKTCAGIATFLLTYATFLGPVSFVQALSGMQYLFLLALAVPLSFRYPDIYGEKLFFWDWAQKVFAIFLIGLGLWLAAMSGVKLPL